MKATRGTRTRDLRFTKAPLYSSKRRKSRALNETEPPSAAPGAASGLECDSDLAAVVKGWPTLPAAIRAGIVAMVKAARG